MVHSMLAVSLLMGVALLAVFVLVSRGFRWRQVDVRSDPDQDPLLARRADTPEGAPAGRRPVVVHRMIAGTLLLALALTAFLVTATVGGLAEVVLWGVVGIGLLYAAVVFLLTARRPRTGPV